MIASARISRRAWRALSLAASLATAGTSPALGQTSVTAGMRIPDTSRDAPRQGVARQLVCRGQAGAHVTNARDSAPDARSVRVSLAYRPNPRPAGAGFETLEPGACSWNPLGLEGVPPEPGTVHFDLLRDGSAYDPDPTTFTKHFADPDHYWSFYVDDVTNVAHSHGWYRVRFWAGDDVRDAGRTANVSLFQRRELRCRGGSGLAFNQGGSAGENLVGMTLAYAVAPNAAGPAGLGLSPGTCAWVDRADVSREPGRVMFVTAGNAQLRQALSGSAVDRSPTAAERWPDAHTIPRYMESPAHYWSFTVVLVDPDSAVAHEVWKRTVAEQLSSRRPGDASRSVTRPPTSSVAGAYTPEKGAANTRVQTAFDIRNVQVTAGLEGVTIRFEAAANVSPTVQIHTEAPAGAAGELRFNGSPAALVVSGTASGAMSRYVAASNTPLARGTRYWYVISAPASNVARANQESGEFRTLAQHVTIGITEINIISDGDSDSNGDLWFEARACPEIFGRDIVGSSMQPLDWTEGRHPLSVELKPHAESGSAPDRFRLLIAGLEDDDDGNEFGGTTFPIHLSFSCPQHPDLEPGSSPKMEWNSIALDFDLTKYPGATATETFLRRSKPLREGSTLMFEVRGYIRVERK